MIATQEQFSEARRLLEWQNVPLGRSIRGRVDLLVRAIPSLLNSIAQELTGIQTTGSAKLRFISLVTHHCKFLRFSE